MAGLLSLIGITFQLLGAICVATPGFRSLWREALFDPARAFIEGTWLRLTGPLRRWIGKSPQKVAHVHGITSVGVTASGRVSRGFAPIADDLSDAAKIKELDRRIREIVADNDRRTSQLTERIDAQDRRLNELSQELHRYASEQTVQDRKRAVRQLQVQAVGLFLVTLGSLFQAAGSLLPSENNPTSIGSTASDSRLSHPNDPTYSPGRSHVAGQATGGLYHPRQPVGGIVAAIPN